MFDFELIGVYALSSPNYLVIESGLDSGRLLISPLQLLGPLFEGLSRENARSASSISEHVVVNTSIVCPEIILIDRSNHRELIVDIF